MVLYLIFLTVLVCFCLAIVVCIMNLTRLHYKDRVKAPAISIILIVLLFIFCIIAVIMLGPKVLYSWANVYDLKLKSDISICAFDNEDSVYLYSNSNDDEVTYYYCYLDNRNNRVIAKLELTSMAEIIYGNEPQINLKLSASKDKFNIESVQITIPPNSLIEIEKNSETEKLLSGIAEPYKFNSLSLL